MAEPLPDLIQEIVSDNSTDDTGAVLDAIVSQDDVAVATLLESVPVEPRLSLWQDLPSERKLDVLVEMRSDPREILIDATEEEEWSALFSDIEAEELLELMRCQPLEGEGLRGVGWQLLCDRGVVE